MEGGDFMLTWGVVIIWGVINGLVGGVGLSALGLKYNWFDN